MDYLSVLAELVAIHTRGIVKLPWAAGSRRNFQRSAWGWDD
jgi:hypothetical protein